MMKKLVVALMAALFGFLIADVSFADEPKLAVQPRVDKEMKGEKKAAKKATKKDEAARAKAAPVPQSPLEPETPPVKKPTSLAK